MGQLSQFWVRILFVQRLGRRIAFSIFSLSVVLSVSAQAQIDDSGLTGGSLPLPMSVSSYLSPSNSIKTPTKTNNIQISSFVKKGTLFTELLHLTFTSKTNCQDKPHHQEIELQADLVNQYVQVKKSRSYQVEFVAECGNHYDLVFDSESPEGQAVMIWEIANRAISKFSKIDRLSFWGGPLTFEWPSHGDYYSWGTVNLTRGDHWDVVGHEMGHAVYDRANIGVFGGGTHYIDQCYTSSLALSEGWASFFSAWVSIDLNDSNAQFEFMVPRRAPLGVEHVPDDVCAGPTNEWRVYSFLWDIIDRNNDGELSETEFQKYWDAVYNRNVRSIGHQMVHLVQSGEDQQQLHDIWKQNFKTDVQ